MTEEIRPLLPDKEFFTVSEVSRAAQVPVHTLRYWEAQFRMLRPVRRASGHRRYARRDVELVLRIKDLLRNRKMTVAGARKALLERARAAKPSEDAALQGARMNTQALRILRDVRDEVRALADELA
ncbi:MAG: MerR family transcriptional regulator [Elusimicrobiota bacterium]